MKKSSKLSLLTAGIAGTLLATSVASVALTACATQTTPDSSQEQYNWFEKQILISNRHISQVDNSKSLILKDKIIHFGCNQTKTSKCY